MANKRLASGEQSQSAELITASESAASYARERLMRNFGMETIDSAEKSFVARRRIGRRKTAARVATKGNIKASRAKENTRGRFKGSSRRGRHRG